jgi:SHAQKYF class myb-like DNA-binding protein
MATRQADHKRRHDATEDTDPAAASVSLRPRSPRRVVPESLIAPKNRRENDTSSSASLPPDEEELEVEMEGTEKKQRFVWTPDLHHRFEIAVHKLGVANAKPQAIQQLMGCEDDGTIPTRQNIKSHLQKYRLRTGHRSESSRSASSSGGSQAGGSQAGGSQAGGSQVGFAAASQAPLDPIAQKQQTGLLEQLELQKKLDAQLLQQRNTQSALDLRMHTAGPGPTLRPAQLQRLARHVLIMRGMLQHLLTLLHAITVDFCAAGQFAQRSFASGPTQVQPHVRAAATPVIGMSPCARVSLQ